MVMIAQYANGEGKLFGPYAEKWGPFNPEYFVTHDGKPLARGRPEPQPVIEPKKLLGMNVLKLRVTLLDGYFKYVAQAIEYRGRYYYCIGDRIVEIAKWEYDRVIANPRLYYFSTALKLHKRIGLP
jgi:hypothetical protein